MGVTVLPAARTGLDVLGEHLGAGMQRAMPQMYENQKVQRGMRAIDQLQEAIKPDATGKIDQGQMLANIARAVTLNPGLERSGLIEHAMKQAQALNAQNVPLPNSRGGQEPPVQSFQRQELPSFLNQPQQENKFFPHNIGPQGGPGNAPQEATTGQKIPIKTPHEMAKEAPALAKEMTNAGTPTTPKEAYEIIKSQNQDNKIHNQDVDKELGQRVVSQKNYGNIASNALQKAYPGASDKMLSIAKKWGEDVSTKGKSESEIETHLIEKANHLANQIDNVKQSLSRPNAINNIERAVNGDYKTFDQGAQDLRNHLKPLLELGLYDEARGLLEELKYGPEEREMIINPLSQRSQTVLNGLPKVAGTKSYRKFTKQPEANIDNVKETLLDLKKSDPNFSPLLARKYAEDRGYDWRMFKDAWNDLIQGDEGNPPELKNFSLSEDQQKMSKFLNGPPLQMMDKILHTLELKGR